MHVMTVRHMLTTVHCSKASDVRELCSTPVHLGLELPDMVTRHNFWDTAASVGGQTLNRRAAKHSCVWTVLIRINVNRYLYYR